MRIWTIVFAVWVFFWAFYLVRGFAKGEWKQFREYAFLDRAEKRAHILGDGLEGLLLRCEKEMPEGSTFRIEGGLDEHNVYRMRYYLYPRMQSDDPQYVISANRAASEYGLRKVR